jgi:hypothetical protein
VRYDIPGCPHDGSTLDGMDAFILGSGFSRGASSQMPTLRELSTQVRGRMSPGDRQLVERFEPMDVEAWLSYLASDQPWLDEAGRLDHRAAFLRVSAIICDVITACELEARVAPLPDWLRRLVARWHEDQATVVTLNYDTIVEAAYTEVVVVRTAHDEKRNYVHATQIRRAPLTPIWHRVAGALGASDCPSFRLVKLHGSIDWVYSGRESFYGEPIFDAHGPESWATYGVIDRPDLLRDKVPLVVPPTSGKSTFFNNEILRGQWTDAFDRLAAANRIFVIGYSLPPTDELMNNLLRTSVTEHTEVLPVNPDPVVADRLELSLPRARVTRELVRPDCLEALAAMLPPAIERPVYVIPPLS